MEVLGTYKYFLTRSWLLKIPYFVWSVFIVGFVWSMWFMPSSWTVKIITLGCMGFVSYFIYRAWLTELHLKSLIHKIEEDNGLFTLYLIGRTIELNNFEDFLPVEENVKRRFRNLHKKDSQLYVATIKNFPIYLSSKMRNFDSIAHLLLRSP